MDFGSLVIGNLVSSFVTETYDKQRLQDSSRSEDDEVRGFKFAKTTNCRESVMTHPLQRCNTSRGSFSSDNLQAMGLPFYRSTAGYASEGFNTNGITDGVTWGYRGPFMPSQWIELEHQVLMYKYIIANFPVPSCLLNPIKSAPQSSSFSRLRSNAVGWSAFHLGFSSNDPSPGRCRRTDGKKWRCSRDAIADKKYCERHVNRGRHRSRKPVEGQLGHSTTQVTTTNDNSTHISSSMLAPVVPPAGSSSKSLSLLSHHQLGSLQPRSNNPLSGLTATSSPAKALPLRLFQDLEETVHMGLGKCMVPSEMAMGGPPAQELHTRNIMCESNNFKSLNLIENWDNSPRLASSSSVILRGTYGSFSNSSAGAEAAIHSTSFCNGLIVSSPTLPSLPAL